MPLLITGSAVSEPLCRCMEFFTLQEPSQCQLSVTRSLKRLQNGFLCPRPMLVGDKPTPHTTESLRLRRGFFFLSHGIDLSSGQTA